MSHCEAAGPSGYPGPQTAWDQWVSLLSLWAWLAGPHPPIRPLMEKDSPPPPPIKAVIPDSDCAPRVLPHRPAPHTLALASVAWEWHPRVMDRPRSPVCSDHELCISRRAASAAEALPPLPPNLPPG